MTHTTNVPTFDPRPRVSTALLALTCALGLAACGSGTAALISGFSDDDDDEDLRVDQTVPASGAQAAPTGELATPLTAADVAMSDPDAQGNVAMWKWFFEKARLLVRESKIYAAGFRFDKHGAFAQDLLTVKPNGFIASYLGKVEPPRQDVLRGLPAEPGMVVFGAEWGLPDDVPTFSEAALHAMMDTPQGREIQKDEQTRAGLDAARRLYRRVSGYCGGMWPADAWPNQLFVNESRSENAWVKVRLHGRKTNRYGVGARLKVVAETAQSDV